MDKKQLPILGNLDRSNNSIWIINPCWKGCFLGNTYLQFLPWRASRMGADIQWNFSVMEQL